MTENGPSSPAAEPWLQRFELQSAGAAALATALGLALARSDEGVVSGIVLLGAYVWSWLALALAALFVFVRSRNGTGRGSALSALAIAAAVLACHLWWKP